jgi:predicted TPR repeat methyltransferase
LEGGRRPDAGSGENRDVLARAIELHRGGALAEAEAIYRRVLAGRPGDPDALHYLGVLFHQRGRNSEAIELIQQAVKAAPNYADAYNNLGTILRKVDRVEDAVLAYRRSIDLRPDDPGTLNNLGVAMRAHGRLTEGIALHRRAIDLAPRFANAHFSLGLALREAGDLAGAVEAFYKVIEITPGHASAYRSLGRALHRAKRHDEATSVFAEWLTQEPGNPVALHLMAAYSGKDVPPRASDAYVEQVFDDFAESFDEHLRRLAYQAPQLAIDALAANTGAARQDMDVLDAGCGTGLCGPLLRPYARRLVGVDLSTGMLAQARGRGAYDDLVAAELTAYLGEHPRVFDVIVSVDTLVYFGDLGPVLTAAAGALRPAGRLVFTVESGDLDDETPCAGYRLNASGRYCHRDGYLRDRLAASGLAIASIAGATLRQEGGSPVAGYVVTARKL